MINAGDFLESPAMRSSGAVTGTRTAMPVRSISTTTGLTTRTTTSASADPKISCLDIRLAGGKPILGRKSPGDSPKARQRAKPVTVAGPIGAATEDGRPSFYELTSIENLYQCWMMAKKGKSQSLRMQRFAQDPFKYLILIQERLRNRTYSFGPYKTFTVQEKKFRHVVDAPMKDRIVHWMLYRYMLPIWQPRFIHDTYGNLPGRGTHAAVNRLAEFARKDECAWALQIDISKYFYSVNHDILKSCVLRYIGNHDVRHLLTSLIDSFKTGPEFDHLFALDSMYRRTYAKGMPIGNLPSQLFANIYPCAFDHWVKEVLRLKHYIRYVDDMTFLAATRIELLEILDLVTAELAALGLTVHPNKIRIAPVAAGVPFLGYVVWENHISAGSYVRGRHLRRLRQHENGGIDHSECLASYKSIFLHTGSTINKKGH